MPADDHRREDRGIACPQCGCRHFYVVYTRPKAGKILRRKECRHCGRRLMTIERARGEMDGSAS
jgi:transcriptional regulator NrdR family protein